MMNLPEGPAKLRLLAVPCTNGFTVHRTGNNQIHLASTGHSITIDVNRQRNPTIGIKRMND
jgi:hypothetical protein